MLLNLKWNKGFDFPRDTFYPVKILSKSFITLSKTYLIRRQRADWVQFRFRWQDGREREQPVGKWKTPRHQRLMLRQGRAGGRNVDTGHSRNRGRVENPARPGENRLPKEVSLTRRALRQPRANRAPGHAALTLVPEAHPSRETRGLPWWAVSKATCTYVQ